MKRKGKYKFHSRGNVILVSLAVLIFAGLSIGVRFVSRGDVLILPEERAAWEARVNSPDNAYSLLMEADRLRIQSAQIPLPGGVDYYRVEQMLRKGSLGHVLQSSRKDDDPELTAYINQFNAMAEKVHEAVQKPFLAIPCKSNQSDEQSHFNEIMLKLSALGGSLGYVQGNFQKGAETLIDALRLAHLLYRECGEYGFYYEDKLFPQLRNLARKTEGAEDLAVLQTEVNKLMEARPTREELLNAQWLYSDKYQSLPISQMQGYYHGQRIPAEKLPLSGLLGIHFNRIEAQRNALFVAQHKKDFLEVLHKRPDKISDACEKFIKSNTFTGGRIGCFWSTCSLVARSANLESQYVATLITIALERYKRENKSYPESLEALAPKYLEKLPDTPDSFPVQYRIKEGKYTLYTTGKPFYDSRGSERETIFSE